MYPDGQREKEQKRNREKKTQNLQKKLREKKNIYRNKEKIKMIERKRKR